MPSMREASTRRGMSVASLSGSIRQSSAPAASAAWALARSSPSTKSSTKAPDPARSARMRRASSRPSMPGISSAVMTTLQSPLR